MNIPKILSIGAATQDVFLDNSPEFRLISMAKDQDVVGFDLGSKIDVRNIEISSGGGATNAATTFARQGLSSSFMGVIGSDISGEQVLKMLDEESIDTSRVEFSTRYNTDYSTILLAPNGERTILTYRGASGHIYADNFELKYGEFDWVYVSNLAGRFDSLVKIFKESTKKGAKIAWNPGKNELLEAEKVRTLLRDVEILIVNKEEASLIFEGVSAEELVRNGSKFIPVMILTDGPDGVWAISGDKMIRAGMYEDVPSVDRTGAGDAFGSGFVSQWAQGANLQQSVLFASANSTAVIQHLGAKKGILYKNAKLHSMPMREIQL